MLCCSAAVAPSQDTNEASAGTRSLALPFQLVLPGEHLLGDWYGTRTWKELVAHHQKVRELNLRKLFADDPTRGERMTIDAVGLYLDYSKNRVTDETLKLLGQLADESGLRERIDAMSG